MMFYLETISPLGRIIPSIHADEPKIIKGHLARSDGQGPRVHHGPKRMSRGHEGLTVAQAEAVYGSRPKFRA